jgi:hypothetical protein
VADCFVGFALYLIASMGVDFLPEVVVDSK